MLLLLLLLIVLIESKWRGILIGVVRIVTRGVVRIASPHRGCRLSSSTRDVVALLSLSSAPRAHSFRRVVGGGGGGVFFFFFSKRFFSFVFEEAFYSKTLQNANAAHRSASRDDAKNASSVFSRRMSLKTLARRGKRTETRNTETTTIVGEEHRFCLVVDERGGRGAEELCASTPDESISRLVQ